ncbi:MAG: helix-turn-helix transcriptional regulator [Candidatus Woesearchaeota archaeon]|jgi:DNA-binding transcriptional ArsR family regulator|nr:helix-turn-helix transcriptional regulator [Candidatus Woesearchaeota archaeon]MDP7323154.1 helix-turn-helix transcriptional regulator [Candidatus Woesearchaeota archaeon]MDP7457888.1 helix-turn-helix transcriptional regulator [Candidatus Woesearchaeota archaeon]|tara:strand:- start:169 stop:492 length:324 start_codon:yes stop_codon:yes gene_type:complete
MICKSYEPFFKTLADPSKLEIINLLSKSSLSVSELCKKTGFEQSRVSHNMKSLLERGFVTVKPHGKERIYALDEKEIIPILTLVDKHVERYDKHLCKCHEKLWRKKQ